MATDTRYTIHTKSNGTFTAEFNTAPPNNIQRGQSTSFSFETQIENSTPDLNIGSNQSYTVSGGTTEKYNQVLIADGGTLTIESNATLETNSVENDGTIVNNGTLTIQDGLVTSGAVLDFLEYGGKYASQEMLNGITKYRSQIPPTATIDSLAIGIEPSNDLQDKNVRGIWAIVDSVSDERNNALTIDRYRFDVTVLAKYTDYNDHTELENDLQL